MQLWQLFGNKISLRIIKALSSFNDTRPSRHLFALLLVQDRDRKLSVFHRLLLADIRHRADVLLRVFLLYLFEHIWTLVLVLLLR